MQKGLRVITLQGAIEKSPILLSQYWNELLIALAPDYYGTIQQSAKIVLLSQYLEER